MKQFPELVKNPVAAIISETNGEKSLVMILHAVINQKPYIAPVYISTNSRTNHAMIDSNSIATTFRKENAILKLLTNAIKMKAIKK